MAGNGIEDISYRVWIGTILTAVLATIAVVLRFVSRYIVKAGLWWDDWVIVVSLIVNWGMAITRWIQIFKFHLGEHVYDITEYDIVGYQKSFLAIQLIYFTNASLTKSSLLLLYRRIFGIVRPFRIALAISWFLVLGWFVACVIASIAGCRPVEYFWTRFEAPREAAPAGGSCFNEVAFFRWNGIANMLLDILMLVLPLPMVWRMKMSRRRRMLLTGVFLMGGFVCVVSLLRIVSFNVSDRGDPTYTQVPSSTWSSVEQGIGIVCACLPTLRPLRQLWGSHRRITSRSSRSSSNPESKRSSRSGSARGRGSAEERARDLEHGHEAQAQMGMVMGSRRWGDEARVASLPAEFFRGSVEDILNARGDRRSSREDGHGHGYGDGEEGEDEGDINSNSGATGCLSEHGLY
ncbi:uncharacterized protein BJX67DRAFT_326749 [Aspergillus lucknowensis]|uniref:Rhodopsin domain-containing protein n=1 Tax=Aspergillus lucknowensis TaxID=176173 RepID=A0ABR4L8Q7_9EURO